MRRDGLPGHRIRGRDGAFRKVLAERGLAETIELKITGCLGFCEKGPIVTIRPKKLIYVRVAPDNVPEIVEKTLIRGEEIDRLFVQDPQTKARLRTKEEIPFYKHQTPLIFGANFELDPTEHRGLHPHRRVRRAR